MRATRFTVMETTRSLATRIATFLTEDRRMGFPIFAAFFILAPLAAGVSPWFLIPLTAVGALYAYRGLVLDRARRAEEIEARHRSSYERRYLNI